MAALAQIIEEYLAGPQTLRKAVAGMSREQLLARPIAGMWSTQEVVCHLADFEPVYADRMKRVIAEDRPAIIGANEKQFAARLAYHDRDQEEELSIIDNTRRQMGRILRTFPEDVLGRVGVHNERGQLSLEALLATATRHISHHVKFILDKRKALGLSS